ncbi:MAG: hypothetical protein [Bacteriophage sp.]|nr:MAG: hypothetical protein [Bacteriophage sp.]
MAFNIDKTSGVGPATINIQPSEYNTSGKDINQTIYVEIGGKRQPINLIQRAAALSWKYTFTVEPTSTSIDPGGGSVSLNIKSTKQQLVNGNPVGEEILLNYTATHYSGNSFVTINGTTLRAEANDNTDSRIETIRFTQAESGQVQDIVIEQAANVHYYFSAGVPSTTVEYDDTSYDPKIESYRMVGNRREEVGYTLYSDSSDMNAGSTSFSFSKNPNNEARTMSGRAVQNDTNQVINLQVTQKMLPMWVFRGVHFKDYYSFNESIDKEHRVIITSRYDDFYTIDFEVSKGNSMAMALKASGENSNWSKAFRVIRVSGRMTRTGQSLRLEPKGVSSIILGEFDSNGEFSVIENLRNPRLSEDNLYDFDHLDKPESERIWNLIGRLPGGFYASSGIAGQYRFSLSNHLQ